MTADPRHPPAVRRSLERWHAMVAKADMTGLEDIVHEDAVFRSPVAHTPYPGRQAVCLVLRAALAVFEDFAYRRAFSDEDGLNAALEFTARVRGKDLVGVDFIGFDEAGLITDFQVMVRPMSALAALGEAMAARLGGKPGR